jgi:hypothetical protein
VKASLGTHQHRTLLAGAVLVCAGALAASSALPASGAGDRSATSRPGHGQGHGHERLDLGPGRLPESRDTSVVQRGVTLTEITRGVPDRSLFWTEEVLIPAGGTSPDPDAPPAALSDRASAQEQAADLEARGFDARVERVRQPRTADVPAGVLGYRVRVGRFATKVAADAEKDRLAAGGKTASSVYTGWDGDASDRGPWHVKVLTIDPRRFDGTLTASYGPDLHDRETTSQLARAAGATAAVNAGFFVLDPAAGAPGDPAGAGVYDGKVLSEAVGDRPVLVLRDDARHAAVTRLTWAGSAVIDGRRTALDGIDRVPNLIRNCGGDATDEPTSHPLHDVTCTDDAELVAFTPEYAASTPAGAGREVVLEHGRVVAVKDSRGTALADGQTSLQATGEAAETLAGVSVGDRLPVRVGLRARHRQLRTPSGMTVVNGGPLLVRDGRVHITQRRDGMVHPGEPSFAYGWFVKRNPRTFAGVDRRGRIILVTVDGRSTDDLGLSIPETADVARSLGMVDAINLDGGGSTTMVVDGEVISHPSDSTGERPVGDALLIGP